MPSAQVTGRQFLNLYRDFLRTSNNFTNYNFKNYFLRKAKYDFRKILSTPELDQVETLTKLKTELSVLKRQSVISQLYTFDKLVVEPLKHKK